MRCNDELFSLELEAKVVKFAEGSLGLSVQCNNLCMLKHMSVQERIFSSR